MYEAIMISISVPFKIRIIKHILYTHGKLVNLDPICIFYLFDAEGENWLNVIYYPVG
jgi:hypothetical protein